MTTHFPRARLAFRANDHFAQSVAAPSGAGLALLPHYIGRSDAATLRRGSAISVRFPPNREVFLLTRRRDKRDPLIRLVSDEVVAMLEETRIHFS
ncbi:hypothetical protein IB244_30950 [Rhizobium sp. RHZ02]|uniref:hypothetical protein n=1 Tax=Rhizobium sp. RHZ02 TaxID=2769306 RepID=UPI001781BCA4|nr:hypothetical protein [Rhizobium sp. RHZ02]MBD9455895.1 hypothetical protein [Rhizobium sp. RHZ02]